MLFSTMIPSLLNLMIGGASLLRGVPWITRAAARNMPPQRAPRSFDRAWITLVLTAQVFLGGLLGIAAQAFLVYVVIGLLLPVFGLDLLGLARAVAAPDLPGDAGRLAARPSGALNRHQPQAGAFPLQAEARRRAGGRDTTALALRCRSTYFATHVSPRPLEPDRLATHG